MRVLKRHSDLVRQAMARLPAIALAAALHFGPGAAARAEPPRCSGADMLAELKTESPQAHARVLAKAGQVLNARHIFWRIEREGLPPSHLFGTVHLTDDRVNALSPKVLLAMDQARRVALEIADLSPQGLAGAMARVQPLLVFADGRSLEKLLTPQEFAAARGAVAKAGMPAAVLSALRPWVVTMTLSLSECERRRAQSGLQPLDLRLAEGARQRHIPVVGLETIEDQLRAMAAVPEADQLVILKASLKLLGRADDLMETIVRLYLGRELGFVWPLQIELWRQTGFPADAFASFERELVTVRNRRMRDAALPLLAEGGSFIAVGALHLPGEHGLVELIRAAGFKVTGVE
jgi:hypothetical protein